MILDNGAYEGCCLEHEELLRRAEVLKPTVLVIPDMPNTTLKNELLCNEFYSKAAKYGIARKSIQLMKVLHASPGKLEDFVTAYRIAVAQGIEYIGFSRLTPYYRDDVTDYTRRIKFIRELKVRGWWDKRVKHHALGMLDGNTDELDLLDREGVVSCDSSAPIWRGLHGYALNDKAWPNYEFNPFVPKCDYLNNETMAKMNLGKVLDLCKCRLEQS